MACTFLWVVNLFPQAGALDLSFGNNGIVTTAIGSDALSFTSTLQQDGKIIVAGYYDNGANYDFAIARYNTDGSLDSSFGTGGIVTTAFAASDDFLHGIAIQGDGKIVAVGSTNNGTNNDFAVVRYNTDGTLDSTFGINGKVITTFGSYSEAAMCVAIQADGKIVAAGYASTSGYYVGGALARYNIDGSLDGSFGNNGKQVTFIETYRNSFNAIVIQPDNRIVVGGTGTSADGANPKNIILARYNTNGNLDTTFDNDGKVLTSISSGDDVAYGLKIQQDGKIVAVGNVSLENNYPLAIIRYNVDGSLDTSFGSNGIVLEFANTEGINVARSVVIQEDGKIIAGGFADDSILIFDFILLRLESDGSIDTSFGENGKIITPVGNNTFDYAYSVLLQDDNKIVLSGFSGSPRHFVVARYDNDTDLGLAGQERTAHLTVAPVPLMITANVNTGVELQDATMTLYNATGQIVRHFEGLSGSNFVLERGNLANGLYLLQFKGPTGMSFTKTIVIGD
ncbi:T9SS type A sorting domain-containing protein [Flavobacterium magnum]|nr:T9SS type A sorting domain-containing protein [Flavobacterium magnum]